MEWNLSDGETTHRVALQGTERDFAVQIGKNKYTARVLLHTPPRLTLLVNNRHVVEADAVWKNGTCALTIDNIPYTLSLDQGPLPPTTAKGAGAKQKKQDVTAPLPGRIVEILVKPGDTVKAGQSICIIEAMKMQNEIFAGSDGTVAEIKVKPGQPVETGALLVKIT